MFSGTKSQTVSEREKRNRAVSRKAAAEGMVLMKNQDHLLPLEKGCRIALYGSGARKTVKGGIGSGDVNDRETVSIEKGLLDKGFRITTGRWLDEYDRKYKTAKEAWRDGLLAGADTEDLDGFFYSYVAHPFCIPDSQGIPDVESDAETAVYVISRRAGEAADRSAESGDYYLTEEERKLIASVTETFEDTIVILNIGGVMDTSWFVDDPKISAVLLAWQGGMEGGAAIADLLLGVESPSGKLPDTLASGLEDYPSTAGFHESPMYVDYIEDIFVGYRYFETIPGAAVKVNYPFGYGLTYTDFSIDVTGEREKDGVLSLDICVKNTGGFPAKEVVQIYGEAPQGVLGKPKRVLLAFEKTKMLQPQEEQVLTFEITIAEMASYDDLGKIKASSYVLEKGTYGFYVGDNVRDAKKITYTWQIEEDRIVSTLHRRCAPSQLKERLRADGSYEALPQTQPYDCMENVLGWDPECLKAAAPAVVGKSRRILDEKNTRPQLIDVAEGRISLDEFTAQLSEEELVRVLGGQPNTGAANTYGWGNIEECGVPNVMTADGPAGLRILPECEIYTTAWPIATQLASTWNRDLLYRVGLAAAEEVKENNMSVWLAPGVNIHRNPLCGRNFEYYSEDPLLAAELASSLIQGVQSIYIAATVKHFCCNNKETNRRDSDSRVSERALREIYLKVFERIIKKSSPWALMSCYNKINGHRGSENRELLENILREEWGYQGVVTSDWFTFGEHYKEVLAGNDIKMGCGYPERLLMAVKMGVLTRENLERSAKRVFRLILKID